MSARAASRHSTAWGILWMILSLLSFLSGPVIMVAIDLKRGELEKGWLIPGVLLGVYCFKRGRKRFAKPAETALSRDPRPPILYLRSFAADAGHARLPGEALMGLQEKMTLSLFVGTEEQQIADVFSQIGPFVAIGKPDEPLPELGASRMYVSDSEWQAKVGELMQRAALVVFSYYGETRGTWWEVEHAVARLDPERVIFLLPGFDIWKPGYEQFRIRFGALTHRELPAVPENAKQKNEYGMALYFDGGWSGHLLRINRRETFLPEDEKVASALAETLEPLISRRFPQSSGRLSTRQKIRNKKLLGFALGVPIWLVGLIPVVNYIPQYSLHYVFAGIVGFFAGLFFLRRK
jgi:hypothetical protein